MQYFTLHSFEYKHQRVHFHTCPERMDCRETGGERVGMCEKVGGLYGLLVISKYKLRQLSLMKSQFIFELCSTRSVLT